MSNTTTAAEASTAEDEAFSVQLRRATTRDHGEAEGSRFMGDLMGGGADVQDYAQLLAQQYFFYDVLESAGRTMADDPVGGAFVFEELERVPSLEADLEALLGADWRDRVAPTGATTAYVMRMNEVCFDWPGGFVAHHYTRYMGDLSGGVFIGRAVREQFGLSGAGASFFDFDGIPDNKAFKGRYRELLDEAPWSSGERERVVQEVHRAYAHNAAVLSSISPG